MGAMKQMDISMQEVAIARSAAIRHSAMCDLVDQADNKWFDNWCECRAGLRGTFKELEAKYRQVVEHVSKTR